MKTIILWYLHQYPNCKKLQFLFDCSRNTIRNWFKISEIKTPKGFYSTGKKVGRPQGIPMSEEQKQLRKEKFKGKGNPFFGKKHSKETRKKLRGERPQIRGNKNPFVKKMTDPEFKDAYSKLLKERWKKVDREKFGKKISKALASSEKFQNQNFHKNHKSGHIETKKAGKIFFRSSWEESFALLLDQIDEVESFEMESFYVPYKTTKGERYTRIDFKIITKKFGTILIEIKPLGLRNYKNNGQKIKGLSIFAEEKDWKFFVIGNEIQTKKDFLKLIK